MFWVINKEVQLGLGDYGLNSLVLEAVNLGTGLKCQLIKSGLDLYPYVFLPNVLIPLNTLSIVWEFTLEGKGTNGTHFHVHQYDVNGEQLESKWFGGDMIPQILSQPDFPSTKVVLTAAALEGVTSSRIRILDFRNVSAGGYWIVSDVKCNGVPVAVTELGPLAVSAGAITVGSVLRLLAGFPK